MLHGANGSASKAFGVKAAVCVSVCECMWVLEAEEKVSVGWLMTSSYVGLQEVESESQVD